MGKGLGDLRHTIKFCFVEGMSWMQFTVGEEDYKWIFDGPMKYSTVCFRISELGNLWQGIEDDGIVMGIVVVSWLVMVLRLRITVSG